MRILEVVMDRYKRFPTVLFAHPQRNRQAKVSRDMREMKK